MVSPASVVEDEPATGCLDNHVRALLIEPPLVDVAGLERGMSAAMPPSTVPATAAVEAPPPLKTPTLKPAPLKPPTLKTTPPATPPLGSTPPETAPPETPTPPPARGER